MNNNINYLTVTEINRYIKNKIDSDSNLNMVYLKGEISNFKAHPTGHLYFTIKDENSRILAIMFASAVRNLNFKPQDGDKVLIVGRISVYEANGAYQIYVNEMVQDGIGNLYLEYEKLKKKLEGLGYFDPKHKKPIPRFPKKIGIVTASSGAAIRDIITTINRRYNLVELYIFPCFVQGGGSGQDVANKIRLANNYDLDTLIIGRGGGSIEDLWAFNEEVVAQAIYDSKIPIISGVGHEVDFTIADFVSDLRAPTPTAAAELAVPNKEDLLNEIKNLKIRSAKVIINEIKNNALILRKLMESNALKNPINVYEIKAQKLDYIITKLIDTTNYQLEGKKNKYLNIITKLEPLNPLLTIKRGYAILKKDDKAVSDIKNIKKDDIVNIEIDNGIINSKVIEVKNK